MANEFKVKKGLIVDGSNTVLDIQGTQGQLFSVTDSLTGDLFSVSDISGIPIFNVNSSGLSTFDGLVSGITPVNAANFVTKAYVDGSGGGTGPFLPLAGGTLTGSLTGTSATFTGNVNIGSTTSSSTILNLIKSTSGVSEIKFLNVSNEKASIQLDAAEDLQIFANTSQQIKLRSGGADALTLDSSQNATFAGDVDIAGNFSAVSGTASHRLRSSTTTAAVLQVRPLGTRTGITPIIQYRHTETGGVKYLMAGTGGTYFSIYNSGVPTDASSMIRLTADNSNNPSIGIGDSGSGTAHLDIGGNVLITNSGNSYFNGGNVGIGTPSPAALLTIKGTGDAIRVESTNTGAGGAQMDLLHFTTSPADGDNFAMINMGGYYTGTTSVYGTSIKSIWTDVSARDAALTFSTNNSGTLTEAIRVDSSGKVGIGTDAPGARLQVNDAVYSQIRLHSDHTYSVNRNWRFITNNFGNGNWGGFSIESSSSQGGTSYTPKFGIDVSGNVGIGINANNTAVSAKLHVAGNSILANNTTIDPDSVANTVVAGAVADGGGWGLTTAIGGNAGTGHSWGLGSNGSAFYMGYQNGSAVNTLQSFLIAHPNRNVQLVPTSGYVSIGSVTPKTYLDVYNDADVWHLMAGGATKKLLVGGQAASGDVVLQAGAASTVNNAAVTTAYNLTLQRDGGNVGIGDTNPAYRLSVKKVNAATPAIMVSGAFYGGPRIQTYGLDADANAWMGLGTDMSGAAYEHNIYFSDYNNNGRLSMGTYNGTTYSEKMCVLRTGYVGIGTANPVASLNVGNNGNIRIDGNASGGGIYASSNGSNNTFSFTRQDGVNVGDLSISGYSGVGITGARTTSPASSAYSLYVKSDGNVGIGTTAPNAKLDVQSSTTGSLLSRVYNSNTSGTGTSVLRIANGGNQANGARLEFSDLNYYNATISVDRTNGMRFMVHDDSNSMADLLTHPVLTLATNKNASFTGDVNIDSSSASGSTVLDVQGTEGQLFSVTNSLTGDLFSVSDISGIPILNVNSSGLIDIDGETTATGNITINKDAAKLILQDTGTGGALNTWVSYTDGNGTERAYVGYGTASNSIFYVVNNLGDLRFHAGGVLAFHTSSTATTFEKTAIFNGDMTLPAAADHFLIGAGSLQTTSKIKFGLPSWNNSIGLESYWMVLRTNQNEGLKLIDSAGNTYVQFNASNNSTGNNESTFIGQVRADNFQSTGSTANIFLGSLISKPSGNTQGFILRNSTNGIIGQLRKTSDTGSELTCTTISATSNIYTSAGSIGNLNASSDIGQQLEYGDAAVATLRCDANRWRVYMGGAGNSQETLTVNESGDVGIKDSTPSYRLDVAGTIRATGDVIAYSDERVKENIKTINNSLEKVNKLRGVEFNKIGEDKKSIGVIAQEIEKILPEVVRTDDKGMKSVAYGNIVGVLIEAVKELTTEVEQLKKEINGGTR